MLIFPMLLSMWSVAAGGTICNDLTGFSRGPPPPLTEPVSNQFAQFDWASDADDTDYADEKRIWNYIWNKSASGLGAVWAKAGIKVPVTNPIPAGKIFCHRYLVYEARRDLDAPITYGTNKQEVQAQAYVRGQRGSAPLRVDHAFDTAYVDNNGKLVNLEIGIYSAHTETKELLLSLSRKSDSVESPEIVIGIANLGLTRQQIANAAAQVERFRGSLKLSSLREFLGPNAEKFVLDIYPEREVKSRLEEEYLLFAGEGKQTIALDIPQIASQTTEVIVFDKTRNPLFATTVELLAPAR